MEYLVNVVAGFGRAADVGILEIVGAVVVVEMAGAAGCAVHVDLVPDLAEGARAEVAAVVAAVAARSAWAFAVAVPVVMVAGPVVASSHRACLSTPDSVSRSLAVEGLGEELALTAHASWPPPPPGSSSFCRLPPLA